MKVAKRRDGQDWCKNANHAAFERDALKMPLLAGSLIPIQGTHPLIAIRSFLFPVYPAIRSLLYPTTPKK